MNPAQIRPSSPANPLHKVDNLRAIWWIMFSVLGSSAMAVAVRDISVQIDSRMIVFLRSAISSGAILLALIMFARLRAQLRFSQPMRHIMRGTLIAGSTHFGFYAIANLPMATVTVLFFLAPIWATLLAMLIHKERVGPRRILAISVGFIGALIILRPGIGSFEPIMLAALASSMLFALALTMSRGLAQEDGAMSAYFSSVLIASAAYVLYGEIPDYATVSGAIIITAATLYIGLREARLKRLSARSAPP